MNGATSLSATTARHRSASISRKVSRSTIDGVAVVVGADESGHRELSRVEVPIHRQDPHAEELLHQPRAVTALLDSHQLEEQCDERIGRVETGAGQLCERRAVAENTCQRVGCLHDTREHRNPCWHLGHDLADPLVGDARYPTNLFEGQGGGGAD